MTLLEDSSAEKHQFEAFLNEKINSDYPLVTKELADL